MYMRYISLSSKTHSSRFYVVFNNVYLHNYLCTYHHISFIVISLSLLIVYSHESYLAICADDDRWVDTSAKANRADFSAPIKRGLFLGKWKMLIKVASSRSIVSGRGTGAGGDRGRVQISAGAQTTNHKMRWENRIRSTANIPRTARRCFTHIQTPTNTHRHTNNHVHTTHSHMCTYACIRFMYKQIEMRTCMRVYIYDSFLFYFCWGRVGGEIGA